MTCPNNPDVLCRFIEDRNGPGWLAGLADGFMGLPLRLVLIVVVAWVVHRVTRRSLDRVVARWERAQSAAGTDADGLFASRMLARRRALAQVLVGGARVFIAVVAGFMVLDEVGVELAPLLASAGVVGIAIGFGAQSLVKDFFSGFFLLAEDQLGVGDSVDLGGEASGTVEAVSLRRTRLRDVNGTVWHVPNGEIRRVANRSQYWSRAVVDVVIAPEADVRRATEVIRAVVEIFGQEAAWRDEGVTAVPEVWGVEQLGLGGTTIRTVVTTAPARQWVVARELRMRIKEALDAAGVPTTAARIGPAGPAEPAERTER